MRIFCCREGSWGQCLAKALAGQKDVDFFSANAAAQASRKSSPSVNNEAVQKAAAAWKGPDHRRATNVSARLDAQERKLNLPIHPTTTIGSFPQTLDLRRVRREFKSGKLGSFGLWFFEDLFCKPKSKGFTRKRKTLRHWMARGGPKHAQRGFCVGHSRQCEICVLEAKSGCEFLG